MIRFNPLMRLFGAFRKPKKSKSVIGIFYNTARSQDFTKQGCAVGETPSVVTYTVPANTYSSVISQAAADALAQADILANGQAYANLNGTCTPALMSACSSASALTCDASGGTMEFQAANAGDLLNTAVGVYSPTGGGLNWAYNVTFGGSEPSFTGSETTATSVMNSTAITDTVVRQGRFIIDPLPTNPDAESTIEINGNDVINIKRVNAACLGSAAQKFNLVLLQFVGLECVAAPSFATAINIQRGTLADANVFPVSNLADIVANGMLNTLYFGQLGLTSAQVDAWLIYLESVLTTPSGVGNIEFNSVGLAQNASRTTASDTAVNALTLRGWTVAA